MPRRMTTGGRTVRPDPARPRATATPRRCFPRSRSPGPRGGEGAPPPLLPAPGTAVRGVAGPGVGATSPPQAPARSAVAARSAGVVRRRGPAVERAAIDPFVRVATDAAGTRVADRG